MTIKNYLFGIFATTLLATGIVIAILFNTNPYQADLVTIITFFASLFLFLVGLFTFSGFYLRVYFSNREVVYTNLPISLRQAVLLALIIVGLLIFKSLGVLNIWVLISFVICVAMVELFFRFKKP